MLTPEIIDAMLESGCTAEQLAAVIKADLKKQQEINEIEEQKREERREKDRLRKREKRAENTQAIEKQQDVSDGHLRTRADIADSRGHGKNKEKEKSLIKKEKEIPIPKEKPPKGVKKKRVSPSGLAGTPRTQRRRATRIPDDWFVSVELGEWAMANGLARGEVVPTEEQFVDHWKAATGKGSTALDWDAKFRTWVRNDIKWRK